MKYPPVTVHVTVKNGRETIEKCIDSLLNLDYPRKKIWVTDAYSTDGTWEILKKYSKKIKILRIKGNAPKAHNTIISKIKTPFLALTDADCVVDRNWLKNLIKGFTSKNIIATAGYCATPDDVNFLQKMIGKELENRFKQFPKYISRAPTMNLCVRTWVAKKVKMDEKLDVAFETDWGYRLTKYGKMKYVPEAKVYHYHRATLTSYFKQQLRYGMFVPLLYLKHKGKITGDHISTPTMHLQLLLFALTTFFSFVSLFLPLQHLACAFFLSFLFSCLVDILKITKNPIEVVFLLFLYFIRTVAWLIGGMLAIKKIISIKIHRF